MNKDVKGIIKKFPDYTRKFYDSLYYDPKEVWKKNKATNRIKTMPIIIHGTTGIGKTTLAKNIMKKVKKWYDKHGVLPVYTRNASLGDLIKYSFNSYQYLHENEKLKFDSRPGVYILCFDDATSLKVSTEEVRNFFSIRHEAKKYTGITQGIIYSIFLTHDWYYLDKIFRRYGRVAVILSTPSLDKFSRDHLIRLMGKEEIEALERISELGLKEDKYKGVGFVKLPYTPIGQKKGVGIIHFKEQDLPYVEIQEDISATKPYIDTSKLILHIPVEKEKKKEQETLEYLKKKEEKQREWSKISMRKKRAREKQQIQEAEGLFLL